MLGRSSQQLLETSSPGPAVEVAATAAETGAVAMAAAPLQQNENSLPWGGGGARVRMGYEAHLTALSLQDR